jgi:hypothetical protein
MFFPFSSSLLLFLSLPFFFLFHSYPTTLLFSMLCLYLPTVPSLTQIFFSNSLLSILLTLPSTISNYLLFSSYSSYYSFFYPSYYLYFYLSYYSLFYSFLLTPLLYFLYLIYLLLLLLLL